MPQEVAKAIGIEPAGTVLPKLADGTIAEGPYGFCLFTDNGKTVAGNAVIGPPGSEPLVGTRVLQDFRLIVDLARRVVIRGRAMWAKYGNPLLSTGGF